VHGLPRFGRGFLPVGLNGRDLRVMVIIVGVCSANKLLGDGITKKNTEDSILDGVGLVLIKRDEDQGVLKEVRVGEERFKEVSEPHSCCSYRGIMTVRSHVRGYFG
jgi:hypothetical protein